MKNWLIHLYIILLLPLQVPAQIPDFKAHNLPATGRESHIYKMLQDADGFIWLGNDLGVYRYDGSTFEYLRFPSHIKNQQTTSIFQDNTGQIWVGTSTGNIYIVNEKKIRLYTPQEGLPKVPITSFAIDKQNRIWFATYGEGVYCTDNNKLYNFNTDDSLSDNFAYSLLADPLGKMWVGTDNGISICSLQNKKKQIDFIDRRHGLPDNIITELAADHNTGVWIGTQAMGIYHYNFKNHTIRSYPNNVYWNYGAINKLIPTENGIWAATDESGVVFMSEGKNPVLYNRSNSRVNSRLTDLLRDLEGNIWIADRTERVLNFNPIFSSIKTSKQGITNIFAICQDKKNRLWFSTNKWVYKYDNDQFTRIDNLPEDLNIVSIYEDRAGFLWLGTFGKGVYRYNPQTGQVKAYTEKEGLINNNVLSIAGNNDEIWFATLGGVSRCSLNAKTTAIRFTSFSKEDGLGVNYIYQVFIDSKKRVWFATDGKGVTVFENGRFINYNGNRGLRSKVIYAVTEDADGNIWLSSAKNGIYRFDGKAFKNFGFQNGLRDLSVTSLMADKAGNLLIVSKKGIDQLNIRTLEILYHGDELGLSELDPNLNAACYSTDGNNIWLGTQDRIICYNPTGQKLWKGPKPFLKQVLVFLNGIGLPQQPAFGHSQNQISFDYTGFWYHDPKEVSYLLKLDGFDNTWIKSANQFTTYSNLAPGHYTFRLKASANKQFRFSPEVTYSFTITPPFWSTWWFYLLSLSGMILLIYIFIKQREKKLQYAERIEKDKVEFQFETLKSQVNPHFLFNSFNTLAGIIEKDPQQAVEYVDNLSDFYRSILEYREKDTIPVAEELDLLQNYYFLQQKRYGNKLTLKINLGDQSKRLHIAPLTLQLLVENAIKHNVISKEHPLCVEVYEEMNYLVVKNPLHLRLEKSKSTGTGLQNIRNRYSILTKRPILIENNAEAFLVKIPLLPSK